MINFSFILSITNVFLNKSSNEFKHQINKIIQLKHFQQSIRLIAYSENHVAEFCASYLMSYQAAGTCEYVL